MATDYVDDKLIQRLLFVLSDKIQEQLERWYKQDTNPSGSYNIVKLNSGDKTTLDENDEVKILRRQQEIFSDSVVSSPDLANKLFTNHTSSVSTDIQYSISNNIILFIGESPFYFNIDALNYDNGKFYISHLNIKNQSKDAFTLRSNYKVTMKLHFTEFDDLLDKSIQVRSIVNPNWVEYIAPLQLLYKFFDYKTNQFGKNLTDGHGIYLSQTLKFKKDTDIYKQLQIDLGNPDLTKNYHLGYLKHNFEMFKYEEPIFRYFENELTIEYIAYEADGDDKPLSKDIEKYLPKSSANLYRLINDKRLTKDLSIGFNLEYKDKLLDLDGILAAINTYSKELTRLQNVLSCSDKNKTTEEAKQKFKNDIDTIKKKIIDFKKYANLMLFNYILDDIKIYEAIVDESSIGVYKTSNYIEAVKQNLDFSGLLASMAIGVPTIAGAASTGAAAATAAGTSAIAGGLAAAAPVAGGVVVGAVTLMAGYALISAIGATKLVTDNVSLEQVRKDIAVTMPMTRYFTKLCKNADVKFTNIGSFVKPEDLTKQMAEDAKKVTGTEVTESGQSSAKSIIFTTFGEILELISRLDVFKDSLTYVTGGYIFDIDVLNQKSTYVNFYNIPISLQSFMQFLQKQIIDSDRNFKYDIEVFLQDCYENLVKNIIKDGSIVIESLKKSTPKIIKIASTIHKKQTESKPSWLNNIDLLDNEKYKNFKLEFLKSKNINFSTGLGSNERLYKIYVFGTVEEMKYYDFYNSYAKWAVEKNLDSKRFLYNIPEFQKFVNEEHLIPCLLMKNVSDSESILKKKYINFSRQDNVNMETGNYINGSGVMRRPYQFSADFKIFMSFFCDIGSYIFISPPISKLQTDRNMFGFGGLYLVKGAELDYHFQRIQDGNVTLPNLESKYTMNAVHITHGDSILNNLNINKEIENKKIDCQTVLNQEPATLTKVPVGNIDLKWYEYFKPW